MAELVGTWKFVESSNMDELFSELGAPKDVFHASLEYKPTLVISLGDNELHMKMITNTIETEQSYELGKEVEELTLDGRIVLAYVTVESDKKLVHIQRHGFSKTVITREVYDDILITTIKNQNQTATIKYQRV
uniref:Lipocalin/cytosolic fatty-acid binding domain-containing protein n=1 Tax=Trichobilharzia regenti TaxID=157069 RepID=A0AA85K1P1_TRIRE|nr:unnamed protein product [Trichobilharzia regenti]